MTGVDVLALGEALVSLRVQGLLRHGAALRPSAVGAELNVAIGLARLGHAVEWVGRLGRDEAAELVLRTLRAEGIRVEGVRRSDDPTGLMVLQQRLPGVSSVDYHRRSSAGSLLEEADLETAFGRPPRIVHLSGVTMALSESCRAAVHAAAERARTAGALVSLDVNYRARLWSPMQAAEAIRPLVPLVDVLVASEDELALVADSPDALLDRGVSQVVVKRGSRGAAAFTAEERLEVEALRVTPVDPVGAGDAFCAGYLSALLDGLPLPDRLMRGNTLGAFAVATQGDWEGLPRRDELDALVLGDGEVRR